MHLKERSSSFLVRASLTLLTGTVIAVGAYAVGPKLSKILHYSPHTGSATDTSGHGDPNPNGFPSSPGPQSPGRCATVPSGGTVSGAMLDAGMPFDSRSVIVYDYGKEIFNGSSYELARPKTPLLVHSGAKVCQQ